MEEENKAVQSEETKPTKLYNAMLDMQDITVQLKVLKARITASKSEDESKVAGNVGLAAILDGGKDDLKAIREECLSLIGAIGDLLF